MTVTPLDTTFARVRRVVIDQFPNADIERITPATHFADDLRTESLEAMELVLAIEDEFDLDVPNDDIPNMVTVESVVALVDRLLKKQEAI